jgi:hypothetical protein
MFYHFYQVVPGTSIQKNLVVPGTKYGAFRYPLLNTDN